MNLEDRIRGTYYGWFFGTGAILRRGLNFNYERIKEHEEYSNIESFEEIPSTYEMYDQLTQTQIIHDVLVENSKITPELFKKRLLELNEKDDILNNEQYGPSTKKAVRKLLEGKDPRETGKKGVTTGGTMRCMPLGVYFSDDREKLIENTYQSCIISHNTDVAIGSALSVTLTISNLLNGLNFKEALKNSLKTVEETYGDFGEPTAFAHVYERIKDSIVKVEGKSFEEATEIIAKKIGYSWYAIEGIPAGFALYQATDSPQEAALMSFKAGYNETAPQIACSFYGAQEGSSIFPQEIIEKMNRKNNIDIDGMVDEIVGKVL